MTAGIGRRRALTGSAGLALATPLLAACGGDDDSSASDAGAGSDGSAESPDGSSGGGATLATTAEVPVEGGTVVEGEKVVVTQPTEGDFRAFTAVCTHQGCVVDKVEAGEIFCPCHGSRFSAGDGSVTNGPATEPLASVEIAVEGDRISLA